MMELIFQLILQEDFSSGKFTNNTCYRGICFFRFTGTSDAWVIANNNGDGVRQLRMAQPLGKLMQTGNLLDYKMPRDAQ